MCWHFWKCKQMLWLWISTGWGLKSIHPLKSHRTKALKSYTIQRDETAELFFFWFCSVSSDLFNLCTRLSPLPSALLSLHIHLSIVSHPLTERRSAREETRKPAAQRASHKEQQLCASVVHNRWNRSWCSSEAPRYHDTYCTTQRKNDRDTVMCTQSEAQTHMDTYSVQHKNGICKL